MAGRTRHSRLKLTGVSPSPPVTGTFPCLRVAQQQKVLSVRKAGRGGHVSSQNNKLVWLERKFDKGGPVVSISRVDPLPHQLEAVYEYLLKLPRVRFLLADDAGAGKTIMAGLLIRELKLRGLAERVLVVCPANLTRGVPSVRSCGSLPRAGLLAMKFQLGDSFKCRRYSGCPVDSCRNVSVGTIGLNEQFSGVNEQVRGWGQCD
jgi:hypothetical protein